MKRLLIRLAALFGLVPARRYEVLARTAEELRSGSHAWKAKAGEALARVKVLEGELNRQGRRVKAVRAEAERLLQTRGELALAQTRLADTERDLAVAREHLMAIEVKLDILEGAANVLDVRTRSVLRSQRDQTGAAV